MWAAWRILLEFEARHLFGLLKHEEGKNKYCLEAKIYISVLVRIENTYFRPKGMLHLDSSKYSRVR
ncbi:unnamed protein product [Sphenostylis stenocarpa]|uniref:Uncharacterized protein n=1 Tax=Sphenostylis stenocarpa TaxID=92480 RepID=A0AA86V2T2_9FABA|nr:unnamed protein product [Sphenostylis stenocarpa]